MPAECIADQQKQMERVVASQVSVVTNSKRLHEEKYDEARLEIYSSLRSQQFDAFNPNWIDVNLSAVTLIDNTDFIPLGRDNSQSYFQYSFERPLPSSWQYYPDRYKFAGVDLIANSDLTEIHRTTYNALDFMGDIGGFKNALTILGIIFVTPFVQHKIRLEILRKLFMLKPSSAHGGEHGPNGDEEGPNGDELGPNGISTPKDEVVDSRRKSLLVSALKTEKPIQIEDT